MKPFRSIGLSVIFTLVVYSIGCDPAQSRNVPGEFSWATFDEIIKFAKNNYIDPGSIKESRAYIGAAEAATKALPTPLVLYPRDYFAELRKKQPIDKQIPGMTVEIEKGAPYLLLVPNYPAWEKKTEATSLKEKERRKKLTAKERAEEVEKARKENAAEEDARERAWDQVGFERKDFETVIAWIEKNKKDYSTLPQNFKGENPYEKEPFSIRNVFFAAANGFLMSMDPHSQVMETEYWQKVLKESEDSSFEGIGAMLRGGGMQEVVVETPLIGSPALNAGIRAGDVIVKVDGTAIENMPLAEVVKRIRGPKETIVNLEVERKTEVPNLVFRIKRGIIKQEAVSSQYIPQGQIGVIKLNSFLFQKKRPTEKIQSEYESLVKQAGGKLGGLILDIRGNPGGDLDEAIRIAGLFLPPNKVVVQIKRRGDTEERRSDEDPMVPADLPVIVLINAGSASASEIVASALMDHNAALVLGERSFGKATVQGLQGRGDITIKLTTARYYAPLGYTIQVYGVQPDIQVSEEADNTFPPRFREEDMWKHLPELVSREKNNSREAWIAQLKSVVNNNDAAENYLNQHKMDAIKPDYMLRRALTYFEAMKLYPKPK